MEKKVKSILKQMMTVYLSDKSKDIWGAVDIKDHFITEVASSLETLKRKMKKLVREFVNIDVRDFDINYDLATFFDENPSIKFSDVSKHTGISLGLLRKYATSDKYVSKERYEEIKAAVHELSKTQLKTKLRSKRQKQYA